MSEPFSTNGHADTVHDPSLTKIINDDPIGTGIPVEPEVWSPKEVKALSMRFLGTGQVPMLCASHEQLRKMLHEAYERIQVQSEILSKRAEVPEKRIKIPKTGSGW